jgi:rod shape-determining protein MreD
MNYDNNKPKIKRRVIFVVLIIITAIIQNTGTRFNGMFSAHTFLLIPLAVSISMFEREITAAVLGALAGLLWDLSSGIDGYNMLVIMLISAVCSILISRLMRNNIVTALVLSVSAIAVFIFLYIMIYIVFDGGGYPLSQIFRFYLPSFILTSAFIPIYYYLIKMIFNSNRTVEEY